MSSWSCFSSLFFFFFNDTATTEIYTLSLHDALPIFNGRTRTVPRQRSLKHWRREPFVAVGEVLPTSGGGDAGRGIRGVSGRRPHGIRRHLPDERDHRVHVARFPERR